MVRGRQRLPCIPILVGGMAVGFLLAIITQARGGVASAVVALVALLPFVLAAMTGVAKTTTA